MPYLKFLEVFVIIVITTAVTAFLSRPGVHGVFDHGSLKSGTKESSLKGS